MTSLQKILAAARQLFVAHGFDGASMGDIAKQADVNKSLIYHYFPTKEDLWKRCKEDVVRSAGIELTIPTDQGLQIFLETLLLTRYKIYESNPDLRRIVTWQSLADNPDELQGSSILIPQQWQEAIQTLQKRGDINPRLDSKFIAALLISSMLPVTTPYLQTILNTRVERDAYVKALIEYLTASLAP